MQALSNQIEIDFYGEVIFSMVQKQVITLKLVIVWLDQQREAI